MLAFPLRYLFLERVGLEHLTSVDENTNVLVTNGRREAGIAFWGKVNEVLIFSEGIEVPPTASANLSHGAVPNPSTGSDKMRSAPDSPRETSTCGHSEDRFSFRPRKFV